MIVAVGSDHAALERKAEICEHIKALGHHAVDLGAHDAVSVDYPDIAFPLCEGVAQGKYDRGVLICGTGIGMSIAANKVEGIRCALCSESFSARLTREHNDSNILAMGARTIGSEIAKDILKTWLETEFSGDSRHIKRIEKTMSYKSK